MKNSIKRITPWLAAFAIGGAVVLTPVANAATHPASVAVAAPAATSPGTGSGTDPLLPYGPLPQSPYRLGYVDSNHDEANTANGELDLPF